MRGKGGGGHAPQLEGLSEDQHRTLSAFASCTPAPFTLDDFVEERDDYGSGKVGQLSPLPGVAASVGRRRSAVW